jgi:hypothetical protein
MMNRAHTPLGKLKNFQSQAGLLTIYIQFRAKNLKSMISEISCQNTFNTHKKHPHLAESANFIWHPCPVVKTRWLMSLPDISSIKNLAPVSLHLDSIVAMMPNKRISRQILMMTTG